MTTTKNKTNKTKTIKNLSKTKPTTQMIPRRFLVTIPTKPSPAKSRTNHRTSSIRTAIPAPFTNLLPPLKTMLNLTMLPESMTVLLRAPNLPATRFSLRMMRLPQPTAVPTAKAFVRPMLAISLFPPSARTQPTTAMLPSVLARYPLPPIILAAEPPPAQPVSWTLTRLKPKCAMRAIAPSRNEAVAGSAASCPPPRYVTLAALCATHFNLSETSRAAMLPATSSLEPLPTGRCLHPPLPASTIATLTASASHRAPPLEDPLQSLPRCSTPTLRSIPAHASASTSNLSSTKPCDAS